MALWALIDFTTSSFEGRFPHFLPFENRTLLPMATSKRPPCPSFRLASMPSLSLIAAARLVAGARYPHSEQ